MKTKYPTIEEDGSVGEIEEETIKGLPHKYIKRMNKIHYSEVMSLEISPPLIQKVTYKNYKLYDFCFSLSEGRRRVTAFVYVDENYLSEFNDDLDVRNFKIETEVIRMSPWFFSYAQRGNY